MPGPAAGLIVGGAVKVLGGIFGASAAKREARRREAQARALEAKLNDLEANRQEIINPYEDVTNLSSMLSNPFNSLSVATQATEMQMEQTDIALANTLDTIRATGGSAGGATALAQAALQSKAGISADIAKQEQANQTRALVQEAKLNQLTARGEDTLQARNYARTQQMLNLASVEKNAADQARAQATAGLVGGIGSMLGGVGTAAKANSGFGEGFMDELFKIA